MESLKRKKMYEQQRDQMAGQQFNIEQTSFAIDSIKDTATTVLFFSLYELSMCTVNSPVRSAGGLLCTVFSVDRRNRCTFHFMFIQ